MGQFSNSFPKHFSYLCEYAFRFDLSCSFCEYPFIFHCLHCSPSCFDPDSLLLAHLWLGLSWIDSISANKRFSSPKTSSRKPYTSSKQQERQKHSAETTINFSQMSASPVKNAAVYQSLSVQEFRHSGTSHERVHCPLLGCIPQQPLYQHRCVYVYLSPLCNQEPHLMLKSGRAQELQKTLILSILDNGITT